MSPQYPANPADQERWVDALTPWIKVSIAEQRLSLLRGDDVLMEMAVSTAACGAGEQMNSLQTPRGWHQIRACIGAEVPENGVFIGRRFHGEIYSRSLAAADPDRDWILSRILWLSGLEPGINRSGNCDTMRRYIYLHGTPDENPMGIPDSHGCVRMRNRDVIELFGRVRAGTRVWISEQ